MSLFVINRYDGEGFENESETTNSDKLLQRILKKAEKRAKSSQTENQPPEQPEPKRVKFTENELSVDSNEVTQEHEKPVTKTSDFEFTVLGKDKFEKKPKVVRVLPDWLSNPTKVSPDLNDLTTKIEDLDVVDSDVQEVLRKDGFTHYFPIQSAVLPHFIEELNKPYPLWPRDICISASTGSGKTLSYVIPIVQALRNRVVKKIRALVVLPVKELAVQVFQVFKKYVQLTNLKLVLLAGTMQMEKEKAKLVRQIETGEYVFNADIVVTTPGRLVDHLHMTSGLKMTDLRFLVLDEADRMMDREQNEWIYHLEQHIRRNDGIFRVNKFNLATAMTGKKPPLKILASATLTHDPEKLYRIGLFKPRLFISTNIEPEANETETSFVFPKELQLKYFICTTETKPQTLYYLIKKYEMKKVLCFTGSAVETHRLALLLKHLSNEKLKVEELSAQLDDATRNLTVRKFADGEVDVLVSTDALARGLDIPDVQFVVAYNLPNNVQTFVHRVGRTARAGKSGVAITLVKSSQRKNFSKLFSEFAVNMEDISENIDVAIKEMQPRYLKAIGHLQKDLISEKATGLKKVQRIKKMAKKIKKINK